MRPGEPVPRGEHVEYPRAHTEFKRYCESNPRIDPWYTLLEATTALHDAGKRDDLRQVGNSLRGAIQTLYQSPDLPLPQISWVKDPGIHRITGHNFVLPTMVFDIQDLALYQAMAGGKVPQGASIQIPSEMFNFPDGTRPISVVYVPSQRFDGMFDMEYEQRRRHELVHAVDPNSNERNAIEAILQEEVAATIGEVTETAFYDFSVLTVSSAFILPYLAKTGRQFATREMAEKICRHIDWLTSRKQPSGVRSNAELSRNLLLATEDIELHNLLKPEDQIVWLEE